MAAAGKICTGFSKPYVATYNAGSGTPTYSGVTILARGVDVSIEPETGESNIFHADNIDAENAPGTFTGGTVTLNVDGLLATAEKLIMGLPEPSSVQVNSEPVSVYGYGDNQKIPYLGLGFVVRYMSGGEMLYTPYVLTKVQFQTKGLEAATQEEEIEWQPQELTATIMRDDSAEHMWIKFAEDQESEEAAEAVLKVMLGGGAA